MHTVRPTHPVSLKAVALAALGLLAALAGPLAMARDKPVHQSPADPQTRYQNADASPLVKFKPPADGLYKLTLRLERGEGDRLAAAIGAYFDFALANRHAWTALYDFRLHEDTPMPPFYAEKVAAITGLVVAAVAGALPKGRQARAVDLARSLLATVHGHCFFALNGTFALLGEGDPLAAAQARVREAVEAASR